MRLGFFKGFGRILRFTISDKGLGLSAGAKGARVGLRLGKRGLRGFGRITERNTGVYLEKEVNLNKFAKRNNDSQYITNNKSLYRKTTNKVIWNGFGILLLMSTLGNLIISINTYQTDKQLFPAHIIMTTIIFAISILCLIKAKK